MTTWHFICILVLVCFIQVVFSCAASARKDVMRTSRPTTSERKETPMMDIGSANVKSRDSPVSNCTLKQFAHRAASGRRKRKHRKHRKIRRKHKCHRTKKTVVTPSTNTAVPSSNSRTRIRSGNNPRQDARGSIDSRNKSLFAANTPTDTTTTSPTTSAARNVTMGKTSAWKGSGKTPTVSVKSPSASTGKTITRAMKGAASAVKMPSPTKLDTVVTARQTQTRTSMTTSTTDSSRTTKLGTESRPNQTAFPQPLDPCTAWERCPLHRDVKVLGWLAMLPACPCIFSRSLYYNSTLYDQLHGRNFHWRVLDNIYEKLSVYKPTAAYCIRQLVTRADQTVATQQCCYDNVARLITRGSGAGTPNLVAPELNHTLHVRLDLMPYHTCQGDWTRYQALRPPNNALACKVNPPQREFRRQVKKAREF